MEYAINSSDAWRKYMLVSESEKMVLFVSYGDAKAAYHEYVERHPKEKVYLKRMNFREIGHVLYSNHQILLCHVPVNNTRYAKAVQKLDDNGRLIETYRSAREAAKRNGLAGPTPIIHAISQGTKSCGYKWRYKSDINDNNESI